MNSQTDAELVLLARAGNRDAYGELIRRYQRSICGLACLLVGDRFEAEDLTQEAFLRAWRNLDLLGDPQKFAPWLRRIVFGVSIDWLRAFRPDLYRSASAEAEAELSRQSAPAEAASGVKRLEALELRERIWAAVARLPPRYRLPLTLFHLDGLSHARVAAALGVSESTARSLVTRARQKLQPMLAAYAADVLPALEDVFREQSPAKPTLLHITDGESVAGTLRESMIPGVVSIYGDLLYEGPAPAGLDAAAWIEIRAAFRADLYGTTPAEARAYLQGCEATLAAFSQYEEVVIWLDHRLSDQLILLKLLDWFSRRDLGGVRLSLICVGPWSGVDNFIALGALTADQLVSLADTRLPVSAAQFRLAQAAWQAFTSPNPTAIERILATDTTALPFVAAALRRHLEEFPAVGTGLSRTERQALSILATKGPLPLGHLCVAVWRQEEAVFMGDTSFYRIMANLANAPHPLLHLSEKSEENPTQATLTATGHQVLAAQADHLTLNHPTRWLGGVHLQGNQAAWRWDPNSARIAATPR